MMKKLILVLLVTSMMVASCSMPVAVEEDNSPSLGEKNAELLKQKIDIVGDALHAIHLVIHDQHDIILDAFYIDGIYLVNKNDEQYFNLTEMLSLSVEEITYSEQNKIIRIVF